MALDEVLLQQLSSPILRFYLWQGDWISFGFSKRIEELPLELTGGGLQRVRRRTGGGIVDHRKDLTYSLLIPRGEALADVRGPVSYAKVHQCLSRALESNGVETKLEHELGDNGNSLCFQNPVQFDVSDNLGQKIAGAGQYRGKNGLIHQGSIQNCAPMSGWKTSFAEALSSEVDQLECQRSWIKQAENLAEQRYRSQAWTMRR